MRSFLSFLNLWNSTSTQNRSVLASRTSANGYAFIITSPLRHGKPYRSLGLIGLVGPAAALQLVLDQYRALGDPRVPRRNRAATRRRATAGLAACWPRPRGYCGDGRSGLDALRCQVSGPDTEANSAARGRTWASNYRAHFSARPSCVANKSSEINGYLRHVR